MEFRVVKFLSIALETDEEGNILRDTKVYLPSILNSKDIEEICPEVTSRGTLYKTFSVIKKYNGEQFTVMGNYNDLNIRLIGGTKNKVIHGYKKREE